MKPFLLPALVLLIGIGMATLQSGRRSSLTNAIERLEAAPNAGPHRDGPLPNHARAEAAGASLPPGHQINGRDEFLTFARADARPRYLTSEQALDLTTRIFTFPPEEMPWLLDELLGDGSNELYPIAVRAIFERWPANDRDDAIARARTLDPDRRNAAFEGILASWVEDDPRAAYEFAKENSEHGHFDTRPLVDLALRYIGAIDVDLALELAAGDRTSASNAIHHWAMSNRRAAIDWLLVPENRELVNGRYLTDLIGSVVTADPEEAMALAERMEAGSPRNGALGAVLGRWALLDFDTAETRLHQILSTTERRVRLLDEFADYARHLEPDKILRLAESLPADIARDQFLSNISPYLSESGGALRLIEMIGNEGTRENAMGMFVGSWTRYDSPAVSEYLAEMPASPLRDSAITAFASNLISHEPESAITWAQDIASPALRTEQVSKLLARWSQLNAPAANAWREQNRE